MAVNPSRFAELLTRAVNRIHADEGKKKTIVRDELGYAAGREGRTAVDYWCRDDGHVPAKPASVEGLAREIAWRGGLNRTEMEAFLASADYSDPQGLCRELYPAGQTNGAGPLSWQSEPIQPPAAPPAPADSPVLESRTEAAPGARSERQAAPEPASAPAPVLVHTPVRKLPPKARRLLFLLGLAALTVTATMVWLRVTAKTEQVERGQLQLVTVGEQRVRVETEGRSLLSGDVVPLHTAITVTFQVLNNGVDPIRLRSLTIGVRGPGATCHDNNEQRWSALHVSFPAVTGLTLQPGQVYEYQGSRALYLAGTYFLEPVEQDATGHWGGIPPFTCVDLQVK